MTENFLKRFWPAAAHIDRFERMRASTGALFGLVLTGIVTHLLLGNTLGAAMLIAPMGASSVLLFAVPSSPLAQPWSIIGGNLVASLIGVTVGKLVGAPVLAAGLAGGLAIFAMFWMRCLHPPSGAVALTAVLGGPAIHAMGYNFVAAPVLINSFLLLATALFYNNATGRKYPHVATPSVAVSHDTKDAPPLRRLGITPEDLDATLARYNEVLDISREDLQAILLETERHAYQRRFGVIACSDVMSRDVLSVEYGTSLNEAWQILHSHRLTALPVVTKGQHVIGIVTKADFINHAQPDNHTGLKGAMAKLLQPVKNTHSAKPEVVGQIMNREVRTAFQDQPVVDLVPLMSDAGLHSIPVLDADRRLVGMLTQSDMIATLYEKNLQPPPQRPAVLTAVPGGKA
ncbi:HPP family protein [Noviherbaspirillum pedocola]|nr:HPP family protein [Noviherbaspirillum pedocola]